MKLPRFANFCSCTLLCVKLIGLLVETDGYGISSAAGGGVACCMIVPASNNSFAVISLKFILSSTDKNVIAYLKPAAFQS